MTSECPGLSCFISTRILREINILTIFTECHSGCCPCGQGRQKGSTRKCWRGKYLQDCSKPPTCALCTLPLQWCEYVSVDTLHCTCTPLKAPPLPLPVSYFQFPFEIETSYMHDGNGINCDIESLLIPFLYSISTLNLLLIGLLELGALDYCTVKISG